MKKLVCILLCLSVLLLWGCEGDSAASTEPEEEAKPIRKEVVEAYDMSDAQQKQVADLFEGFDKAFSKLKRSDKTDDDMLAYAQKIKELVGKFEEECVLTPISDPEHEAVYQRVLLDKISLLSTHGPLWEEVMYASRGEASGENCLELAINVVSRYSEFFYGEPMYTEDDLDALGF